MRKAIPYVAAMLVLAANVVPAGSTSPVLAEASQKSGLAPQATLFMKQHAKDQVDWIPWGSEAFAKAKKLNRPIFVSSGFSACHWCHRMDQESFMDPATAAYMNNNFVNVLIDREERPDVDAWLAQSLEVMGVMPGWPISVFTTPEGKPFFGGAYFPAKDSFNLPAFKTVLSTVVDRWKNQTANVREQSNEIAKKLNAAGPNKPSKDLVTAQLETALSAILSQVDTEYGDLREKHKHPHYSLMNFLLASSANKSLAADTRKKCLDAVTSTLNHYSWGALHDHLDGGFMRFCVDVRYNRPHFEKMLYDNALVASLLYDGFEQTGNTEFLQTANATETFMLSRLQGADGQFYSSLSADQGDVEGQYYRFKREDFVKALGEDAQPWTGALGITKEQLGSTVHLVASPKQSAEKLKMSEADFARQLSANLQKLRLYRDSQNRAKPSRDEKVLTGPNALAISSLVRAFKATGDEKYRQQATKCADFLLSKMLINGERLRHSLTTPAVKSPAPNAADVAFLDDYAYSIQALLDLASIDTSARWNTSAKTLTSSMLKQFRDTKNNDLYNISLAAAKQQPVLQPIDAAADGIMPSPVATAAIDMLRQSISAHDEKLEDNATLAIRAHLKRALGAPAWYGTLINAAVLDSGSKIDIVLAANPKDASYKPLATVLNAAYLPYAQITMEDGLQKANKPLAKGKAAVYICTKDGCERPITDAAALKKRLADLSMP
jgi:uncharacterized protein YyaL (SSP411 family)